MNGRAALASAGYVSDKIGMLRLLMLGRLLDPHQRARHVAPSSLLRYGETAPILRGRFLGSQREG